MLCFLPPPPQNSAKSQSPSPFFFLNVGPLQKLWCEEQFDIDHVQEEAETAIQEKAFDLGKKAEKVNFTCS